MESKYTKRLSNIFPLNYKVTYDKTDPLRQVINENGVALEKGERILKETLGGYSLNTINPLSAYVSYFIYISDLYDIDTLNVTVEENSNSIVTTSESEFLSNKVTGFDFEEEIIPNIPEEFKNSEFIGLSRSFNYNNPCWLISLKDNDYYLKFNKLSENPELQLYTIVNKNYINFGEDEYLNILPELDQDNNTQLVAYLKYNPVGNLKLIDTQNLINPTNPNSSGIEIKDSDYVLEGNKITFQNQRSDYNPSVDLNSINLFWFNMGEAILSNSSHLSYVYDKSWQIKMFTSGLDVIGFNKEDKYIYNELNNFGEISTNYNFNFNITNGFSVLLNAKLLQNNEDVLKISFDNETIYLGTNNDNDLIFKTDRIGEHIINTYIDLINDFNLYCITYKDKTYNLYVNNVLIDSFEVDAELDKINNITFGKNTPNVNKCTDILFFKYELTEDEITNFTNYFNEINIDLNAKELFIKTNLIFDAENITEDENGYVTELKSIGQDKSILNKISNFTDLNNIKISEDLLNNHKYLTFTNNSNLNLLSNQTNTFLSNQYTIIAVHRNNSNINYSNSIKYTTYKNNNIGIQGYFGYCENSKYYDLNEDYSSEYNANNFNISVIVYKNNNMKFYLNNILNGEFSDSSINNLSTDGILQLTGNGDLAYLAILDKAITTSEIYDINQYLSYKFDLNIEDKIDITYSDIPVIEKRVGPFINNETFDNSLLIAEYDVKLLHPLRYLTSPIKFFDLNNSEALVTYNEDEENGI